MWPELREEIDLELAVIRQHLETFAAARRQAEAAAPDPIQTAALGAMLQASYNGVENIFKRIAVHCDGGPPRGDGWHTALRHRMIEPGTSRPPAISRSLASEIGKYLRFRHVFRCAYATQLRWEDMAELVADCRKVLGRLESELHAFLKDAEKEQ